MLQSAELAALLWLSLAKTASGPKILGFQEVSWNLLPHDLLVDYRAPSGGRRAEISTELGPFESSGDGKAGPAKPAGKPLAQTFSPLRRPRSTCSVTAMAFTAWSSSAAPRLWA